MRLTRWKAIIFDLDGTLLNTLQDLANAVNYALHTLNLPTYPTKDYRQFVGNGVAMLLKRVLPEELRNEKTLLDMRKLFDSYYQNHMTDCTSPYEGIHELLSCLKQTGVSLGIVSNKPDQFVKSIVAEYFGDIFDAVCGQQGEQVKPDPYGVNKLLEKFGVQPEYALYVGDSEVDIHTAQNARTQSVGVLWGFREKSELIAAGADYIVSSPDELLKLFSLTCQKEQEEYIPYMRRFVGHRPIIQAGASAIIENEQGQILLGLRKDNHCWGYLGGSVELNETVEDAARREVLEESGLFVKELSLLGVFSGPELCYTYPNQDEVSNIDHVYLCNSYTGKLSVQKEELEELRFFDCDKLPENLSPPDIPALLKYRERRTEREKQEDDGK